MSERKMTPQEAIIVLDRLNTSERIDIDRDELREAIRVTKVATQKQVPHLGIRDPFSPHVRWCVCGKNAYVRSEKYCVECGQALDWSER